MTIIVKPFKKHKDLKNTLLKLIDKLPKNKGKAISNTDWILPKDYNREYLNLFYENINEHMVELRDQFNCDRWEIINGWFQQYEKGDTHGWHNHAGCQFSNVYYLELPNKSLATEFYNEEKIKVSEGDILTFSSHLVHRSAINTTNSRKTIISFNSSFTHGYKNFQD